MQSFLSNALVCFLHRFGDSDPGCVLPFTGQSSPLSPFFKEIVTVLLAAAQRHDNNHVENTRLQISAFEAINDMVGGMLAAPSSVNAAP